MKFSIMKVLFVRAFRKKLMFLRAIFWCFYTRFLKGIMIAILLGKYASLWVRKYCVVRLQFIIRSIRKLEDWLRKNTKVYGLFFIFLFCVFFFFKEFICARKKLKLIIKLWRSFKICFNLSRLRTIWNQFLNNSK